MEIEQLTIEDGIFRGSATFKDGTPFRFDITREEAIRFLTEHRKSRLIYDKYGTTLLNDDIIAQHYLEQSERVHIVEKRKANPSPIGGKREGSGRKPKDNVAGQYVAIKLRKDYLELITKYFTNRSDFIQQAIKEKLKREGLI